MKYRLIFLAAALVVAGCATIAAIRWAPDTDFTLAITDNPSQRRFDLVLMSKAVVALCLSKESWPAEAGLPAGFDGAVLNTATGPKSLLPTGSAYCPGGCGEVRIEPGQLVRGTIAYKAFGDAAAIAADANRTLAFTAHPYICGR
ncbi:hypothetical protein [Lysobacter sp. CA199]|uniref:hypothetical protein n=1 Tax=Lysobacter sp. CA199 TaxID=3455608 RepID=UPI003F8D3BBB